MKEEEQLNRATFIREGSKHFYLIRKVTEYQILVDEQLIGSAETLRSAQEKGELEVSDRDLVDQGLPDSKAVSRMIADLEIPNFGDGLLPSNRTPRYPNAKRIGRSL